MHFKNPVSVEHPMNVLELLKPLSLLSALGKVMDLKQLEPNRNPLLPKVLSIVSSLPSSSGEKEKCICVFFIV